MTVKGVINYSWGQPGMSILDDAKFLKGAGLNLKIIKKTGFFRKTIYFEVSGDSGNVQKFNDFVKKKSKEFNETLAE
jgi:hypothetical protein